MFVVAGDGTGEKRLTPAQGEYFTPVWSPDGARIAFAGRRVDNTDVYVMNADGSGERRLTTNAGNDFDPAWSPDGRRIAFTAQRGPGGGAVSQGSRNTSDVYVIDADGAGERRLADSADDEFGPAWSPDGERVAYTRVTAAGAAIWVVGPDGNGAKAIVSPPGQNVARSGPPTVPGSPSSATGAGTPTSSSPPPMDQGLER